MTRTLEEQISSELDTLWQAAPGQEIPDPSPSGTSSDGIDTDVGELLNDAGAVPERSRPALWLVLVRRRPYDVAAETLGIDRAALRGLLTYRDLLMARAAGATAAARPRRSSARGSTSATVRNVRGTSSKIVRCSIRGTGYAGSGRPSACACRCFRSSAERAETTWRPNRAEL